MARSLACGGLRSPDTSTSIFPHLQVPAGFSNWPYCGLRVFGWLLEVIVLYPELRRLAAMRRGGDWSFVPVRRGGELELLAGARGWPGGWSDAVAIRDLGDARAFRCDPVGGVVWRREGGMVEVLDSMLELPEPGDPRAPRLVIGTAPRLWTP